MAEASVEREYLSWSVAEQCIQIEYAVSVLTEIDRTVVDGFNRLRHGGIEVGGVLFGVRNDRTVTILDFRSLACEHALGPGFVLSRSDHLALAGLLESAKSDPALQGLIPVGWYHSHTRSHIHLSSEDIEVFERYFPESSQIALVLRPNPCQPTKAGFFFREDDGRIHSETSYREFCLPSLHMLRPVKTDREMLAERAIQRASTPIVSSPAVPVALPTPPPMNSTGPRQKLQQFTILAILTIAVIGAWVAIQRRVESHGDHLPKVAEEQIDPLTLEDHGGQLRIGWNRNAAPVRQSNTGLLEITEGGRTSVIELDAGQLHSGTVVYNRASQNVAVSLKAGGAEVSAVFAGQPLPDQGRGERLREIADAPQAEPRTPPESNKRDDAADRVSRNNSVPAKPTLSKTLPPAQISRRPEAAAMLLPMPPTDLISPRAPVSAPLIGNLPAIPPPVKSTPIAPRIPAQPRAGNLIWTGLLSKSGVLTIDGNRASTGTLTGAIPGHPVRISVYPAELTVAGLNVYSSNQKYPAGRSEPPAAHNGWNKTSYFQDPWRAGAVKVVEAPNPKNNWKRLVLRGTGVKMSIILIEWEML